MQEARGIIHRDPVPLQAVNMLQKSLYIYRVCCTITVQFFYSKNTFEL